MRTPFPFSFAPRPGTQPLGATPQDQDLAADYFFEQGLYFGPVMLRTLNSRFFFSHPILLFFWPRSVAGLSPPKLFDFLLPTCRLIPLDFSLPILFSKLTPLL